MKPLLTTLFVLLISTSGFAAPREMTEDEIERKKKFQQAVILPFKFTRDHNAANGEFSMLQIRPLYTITTENFNFINRPVIPIVDLRGEVGGRPDQPEQGTGDGASGLGDITYTVAVEARQLKPLSLAAGATVSLPTATSDQLGTGKWSAGPAVMLIGTRGKVNMLMQARQLWSFAGDDTREEVSNFVLEPLITYKIRSKWYFVTDPIISANWELSQSDRWVVPVGGGPGHIFQLWGQWMDIRLEGYYNAIRPDDGPEWTAAFTYTLLFKRPEN
jgi:hypothetical protein